MDFIRSDVLPSLFQGLGMSLLLIAPSAVCGLVIGVAIGVFRVFGNPLTQRLASAYVAVFRGFPLVVQLFIWYFGLPHLGIYFSAYAASVLGFSLCSGAYHSEYVRGALLSIKRGQILASQALGFTRTGMIMSIILPQAIRRALPGCGNELIYLIKYSSLAYMITCIELTGRGKIIASDTFKFAEIFMIIGIFYLVMTTIAGRLLQHVEDRIRIPGFEHYGI